MAEQKNNSLIMGFAATLGTILIGILFIGPQVSEQQKAQDVGNLPATNEKVDTNTRQINSNANSFRSEIDKLNERLTGQVTAAVNLLREEINRREVETYKYIDTLDQKEYDRLTERLAAIMREFDSVESQMESIRLDIYDHIDTPPSNHKRD